MAKRKINGDGENKNQVKSGLNNGIIKVGKGSKIIKSKLQPHPIMATEPPRATCAQFVDGDSVTSLGSLFHCLTTLSMEKNSLISKTTAPHYCQTSSAIHAVVWRERGAAGTLDWSWEMLRANTPRISALSLQDGVWGPGAFPRVSPRALRCPSSSALDLPVGHLKGTEAPMPKHLQNRGAPGLPAHPQEPHSQSDLKSHSLGRVWRFLLGVQGKTAHS